MKNPPYVGEIVGHDAIEPLGESVTDDGKALGVTRPDLSQLMNGRTSLSANALRIGMAFGPSVDHLMQMQLAFDIAQAHLRAGTTKATRCKTDKPRA